MRPRQSWWSILPAICLLSNGEVVGAVGVAGMSKEIDAEIANTAAAALSPLPKTDQRRRRSYSSLLARTSRLHQSCACVPSRFETRAIASAHHLAMGGADGLPVSATPLGVAATGLARADLCRSIGR